MCAAALSLLLLVGVGVVFANDRAFWEVRIELTGEATRALSSQPRHSVNARVQFDRGQPLEARVKLKGHGSFQSLDQKPSFTLQFDPSRASNVPFSSRKIHLNNSIEDPSYLKEKIGAELFRRAGNVAGRVAHARVRMNNREVGLYVLKEGFSEEFISGSFGTTNGTIFDSDPSDQKENAGQMDVDAGDEARGTIKLNELWHAANEVNLNSRFARLEQMLDVDAFLKFIATEVILCHWDGYALSENNFRVYVPADGKIQFLPSGMDQIFAKPDLEWKPRFSGNVARAFMETKSADERYEAQFTGLFPRILDGQQISNYIAEVVTELSPHLSRTETTAIGAGAEELMANIESRRRSLLKQLESPEQVMLSFVDGTAVVEQWQPVAQPEGGKMDETASALVIEAGPKTSASWRAKVRLPAGRYRLTSQTETRDLVALPFGNRQGACLRVLGKNAQSKTVLGTSSEALHCEFQASGGEQVVLVCEVRAAGGQVRFGKPLKLSQMAVK